MKYLSSDSYLSTEIVFLCEIDYLGRTYRFSSYPLSLMDNGSEIPFLGKMNDPGFEVSIDTIGGIKRQSSSVSLSLFFPHNVAQREMEGKTIERASARLFYVLSKNRVIQQNYNQKVYLFEGVITDPFILFADPGEPMTTGVTLPSCGSITSIVSSGSRGGRKENGRGAQTSENAADSRNTPSPTTLLTRDSSEITI